ncbi:DUF2004 domain-containing protein [Pseudomonas sp. F1_0610]|uniref:DUF2004 domain-containing protein n=1 Tax=Pseudomonas sp. F1_0610 TaxID=3114284 RepID=UPI0039C40442
MMQLSDFGIDENALPTGFYEVEDVLIKGFKSFIFIDCEDAEVNAEKLKQLSAFLQQLEQHIDSAFAAIAAELKHSSSTSAHYQQHHLENMSEDDKLGFFDTQNVTPELFLQALQLTSIGIYPGDDDSFAIVDIQLDPEFTNYLLSVALTASGKVIDIVMES